MKHEKVARKNLNTHTKLTEICPNREKQKMKEEKTQGISTETTTKNSYNTNKTTDKNKLLDLRAGYTNTPASLSLYTIISAARSPCQEILTNFFGAWSRNLY